MKNILITLHKTVKVSHRIYFLRSKGDSLFGCCSREGTITLLDADFCIKNVIDCSDIIKNSKGSIEVFDFHTFEDIFCIGSDDEFRVYDFFGKVLYAINEKVDGVYFSEYNNIIWMVKYVDNEHKKISLIIDNIEQDSLLLKDELYQSSVQFYSLPEPDKVCMMFLAGQDGMATFFLTNNNGKIVYEQKDDLDDIAALEFSDDNSKFLSVSAYDLNKISCFAYPSLDILREYQLDEEQQEEEDCQLGYGSFFIDNKYAVGEIGENLYYILDTDVMQVVARFIIEGHEPKPVPFYWPTLKDDEGETTNLSYFYKTKKYLIAPFKLPEDKEDKSFVVLRLNDVKEQIKIELS